MRLAPLSRRSGTATSGKERARSALALRDNPPVCSERRAFFSSFFFLYLRSRPPRVTAASNAECFVTTSARSSKLLRATEAVYSTRRTCRAVTLRASVLRVEAAPLRVVFEIRPEVVPDLSCEPEGGGGSRKPICNLLGKSRRNAAVIARSGVVEYCVDARACRR